MTTERPTTERLREALVGGIAYAIARAPVPGRDTTAREFAENLAPLVIQSGYLEALAAAPVDRDGLREARIVQCPHCEEELSVDVWPPSPPVATCACGCWDTYSDAPRITPLRAALSAPKPKDRP